MTKISSRSSRFYLIVSVSAAVLAAASLLVYLQGLRSRMAESGRLVQLVVAARDLGAGEVLDPSSLSLVDFPDVYLLPGTYTDVFAVTGSTLRSSVKSGEPLLESTLLARGEGGLVLDSLDRGFRAYPLAASSVSFPAAELSAGTRIDILAVNGGGATALLENIEVLHVHGIPFYVAGEDAAAVSGDNGSECILLQVTCDEACLLAAAQEGGKIEVLLRAPEGP